MTKNDNLYKFYTQLLKDELVPAMGCTEPIALAYAAAKARSLLGDLPDSVSAQVSPSIIKNVKSVIVPHTGHLKGIPAAVAAGIVAGDEEMSLEVLSKVTADQYPKISEFIDNVPIEVSPLYDGVVFDIIITAYKNGNRARVRISNKHTNIVLLERNGEVLYEGEIYRDAEKGDPLPDIDIKMSDIWDYVNTVDITDIKPTLDRQIDYNMAIAEEGLRGEYGANVGKVLLQTHGDDVRVRAKAYAAAGSDARMNGCEMPVIINSGSGNQGMTASIPVIIYAKELGVSDEMLYRALALSNLTAIYQKTPLGRLSAYCGAANAGTAAGAAIAYLHGGDYHTVIHTIVNSLAVVSGMICDGAKASCAAKIVLSIESGLLGYEMAKCDKQFRAGDGIVVKGVDQTINAVGRLGKDGMRETNAEIIKMMLGC